MKTFSFSNFFSEFLICNYYFHWDNYLQLARKMLAFMLKTVSTHTHESEKTFGLT